MLRCSSRFQEERSAKMKLLLFFTVTLLSLMVDNTYCALNLKTTIGLFSKAESVLKPTDFVSSTTSNLMSVHSATNKLRGEDNAANRESFNQALVALTVLDVGGGALAPVIEGVVDAITTSNYFKDTREALGKYNDILLETMELEKMDHWSDKRVKKSLATAKNNVLEKFKSGARNLKKAKDKAMQALKSAKNWFNTKNVLTVLGPIFDAATIGINSWSLHTALRDCDNGTCNYGTIYGSTLGICSGIVGILTFAGVMLGATSLGPIGAVVGLTLGIAGTLVENFWPKPISDLKEHQKTAIQNLQTYSRHQLYAANQYLHVQGVTKNDIYVVNQGHLAKIMTDNTKKNVKFSVTRKEVKLPGSCKATVVKSRGGPHRGPKRECPYLVSGVEWNPHLGYDFYGYTPETSTLNKGSSQNDLRKTSPYKGSTILINTDKITERTLRGLNIDTTKGNSNTEYNDLISIGPMENLDKGEQILIKMGAGNDSLNIDGMFGKLNGDFKKKILDADLGENGYNSLSFMGLQSGSGGKIEGINFDPKIGRLSYKHGSDQTHWVGNIMNTALVIASSGKDNIKLFAENKEEKYDFTVMKFAGKGEYEIDVSQFPNHGSRVKRFKIIDGTTGGDGGNRCDNHSPEIVISNLPDNAVPNDILYKGSTIEIFAFRNDIRESSQIGQFHTAKNIKTGTGFCKGEFEENYGEGGTKGKQKIATIFLSTKCPVNVRAVKRSGLGGCVLNRPINELDFKFFGGRKIIMDFSQEMSNSPTDETDMIFLKCPTKTISKQLTFNFNGGEDTIVLKKDLFIDPCEIGDEIKLIAKRDGKEWKLCIENSPKFEEAEHIIIGAVKVVNEFGVEIFEFSSNAKDEEKVDLYDLYKKQTNHDMVGEKPSEEVKKEMLKCMKEDGKVQDKEERKEYKEYCKIKSVKEL